MIEETEIEMEEEEEKDDDEVKKKEKKKKLKKEKIRSKKYLRELDEVDVKVVLREFQHITMTVSIAYAFS